MPQDLSCAGSGRQGARALAMVLPSLVLASSLDAGGDADVKIQEQRIREQAMNSGLSVMLIGSVAFMMGLFYITNQADEVRKMHSWKVISATISIFSAVLLFQGVNGVVEEVWLQNLSDECKVISSFGPLLVFLVLLQVLLKVISDGGRVPEDNGASSIAEEAEQSLDSKFETMECELKCWAVLMGHITGFSGIHAFARLQLRLSASIPGMVLVAPLAWCSIALFGKAADNARETIAVLDGEKDRHEVAWDEAAEETEDDIIGLTVSYLIVQLLRYAITGEVPSGEEEEDLQGAGPSDVQTVLLAGAGIGLAVVEYMRMRFIKAKPKRFTPQLANVVSMCLAWCLFFSTDWYLSAHFQYMKGMMKEVVVALLLTSLALGMIFFLDTFATPTHSPSELAEASKTHELEMEEEERACQSVVSSYVRALGILIGFGWEKAFDTAVEGLSDVATVFPVARSYLQLLLAILLTAIVIPAWRFFILPTIIELEERLEPKEEEFHQAAMNGLMEPLLKRRMLTRKSTRRGSNALCRRNSSSSRRPSALSSAVASSMAEEEHSGPMSSSKMEQPRHRSLQSQAGCELLGQGAFLPTQAPQSRVSAEEDAVAPEPGRRKKEELTASLSAIVKELDALQQEADVAISNSEVLKRGTPPPNNRGITEAAVVSVGKDDGPHHKDV